MTTEKNEEMTSEEVLTCAINIGEQLLVSGAEISRVEDLQCLRDPAEPYFLDRVVYHRDAGDEGAEVDHADAKNFKLRDGYVEAGPAE